MAIIFVVVLLVCPSGQRRFMIYGLLLALVISDVQQIFLHYNRVAMPSETAGYIYRIKGNKAEIYIDDQKYKIKAKGLSEKYEGQYIKLTDVTHYHQKTLNQHTYNYQQHYQLLGYRGYLTGRLAGRLKAPPDRLIRRVSYLIRGAISDYAESLSPRAEVLCKALILGEIDDNKLLKQVKSLGLLHLFVISGFHFAIIAGLFLFLLRRLLMLPYRLSITIVVMLSLLYLAIIKIGFGSIRASFMLIASFFCFFVKRKADSVQIALIFVFITLCINTAAVFDLGFQLTTLTYIAVVVGNRYIKKWSLTPTLQVLVISVIVYLTIASVLVYSQAEVAFCGILLVSLLTPLIGAFIVLVIIGLALNGLMILPQYSWVLGFLADSIYDFIIWSKDLSVLKIQFSAIFAIVIVIIMLVVFMAHLLTNRAWRLSSGLALGLLISGLVLLQQVNFGLAINSYALYDGEAYLIRAPGVIVMYDVGNSPEIIEILRRSGITKIDAIIISHAHQDHDGMLQAICQKFDVVRVITEIEDDMYLDIGDLRLRLYQAPQGISNNINDSSIACHLQYGAFDMLLNGDMEEASTKWLIEKVGNLPVEVLKVPHHGSYNAHFLDLVKICQPKLAVIAGGNGKRIDKKKTYHILKATKTPFYDTMTDGEICIKVHNNRFIIKSYHHKNIAGDCVK